VLPGADPVARATALATADELAILGSLIELTDSGSRFLQSESVLLHARQTFGARSDLIPALDRLVEGQLVVVASNNQASVVGHAIFSDEIFKFVAGRVARELGRTPLPKLATAVFEWALQPRLGPFSSAHFGVGDPTFAVLASAAQDLHLAADSVNDNTSLLASMRLGAVPLYACIAYGDVAARDRGHEALSDLQIEFARQHLRVTQVLDQPVSALPSRRLIRAFERVFGTRTGGGLPVKIARRPLAEVLAQRATSIRSFAACATEVERLVCGLLEPRYGYVYSTTDDETSEVVFSVLGTDSIMKVELDKPVWPLLGLAGIHIMHRAQLPNTCRVVLMEMGAHRAGLDEIDHPVRKELERISGRIVEFNRFQRRASIPFDAEVIEPQMQRALDQEGLDAERIAAMFGLELEPNARSVYILIHSDRARPEMIPDAAENALVLRCDPLDRPQAQIRIIEDLEGTPWDMFGALVAEDQGRLRILDDLFSEPGLHSRISSASTGSALDAISTALGYLPGELRLKYEQS